MRAEELHAALADAAVRVPAPAQTVANAMRRRVRQGHVVKVVAGIGVVGALVAAVVVGPQPVERNEVATVEAPAPVTSEAGGPGRLVIPGVTTPIAVLGRGQLALHDPETGDRAITPIARLNGTTSATSAVAVGPWIVVATGGGPGSRAFALDTRDPTAPPRRLGPASSVVSSATPGLVWLAQADGSVSELTLGGLQAEGPFQIGGTLVGAIDAGLFVQTTTGASVVDPATGTVKWSMDGATALAAQGRRVAWCPPGCRLVHVTEVGGDTLALPASPGAVGSYEVPAAFSPDGRWLAVARGTIVVVHDVNSRTTPSVLAGGGSEARTFAWTGDWLVFSGGTALEVARAPSFSALRYIDAGVQVRAVVALGITPEAGGPTVVAGGPFFGDGWFVRASLQVSDAGTQVCFGILAAPAGDCLATSGGALETRLVGGADRRTIVGVVRDDRIADLRIILSGTNDPAVVAHGDVVRVQGGYRVFAWRAAAAGTANVDGLSRDGEFVAGATVIVP